MNPAIRSHFSRTMPNRDGSLKDSDRVALSIMLDRMIVIEEPDHAPSKFGILDTVIERISANTASKNSFMRVVEALSLDMMAHAVGGFAALTVEEQIQSLRAIETSLPEEFDVVLQATRDTYYDNPNTPDRPKDFESENEIFGKVLAAMRSTQRK